MYEPTNTGVATIGSARSQIRALAELESSISYGDRGGHGRGVGIPGGGRRHIYYGSCDDDGPGYGQGGGRGEGEGRSDN